MGDRGGPGTFLRVVLVACVLRAPVVVVAPLVPVILLEGDITAGVIGLATGVTLFCFAGGTFLVPSLIQWWGPARLMNIGLLTCAVGMLVRSGGGDVAFLLGAVVLGMGIGCLNVAVPSFVSQLVSPARIVGSLVAVGLNVGAILAAAAVVLVDGLVDNWRVALCLPFTFLLGAWVCARARPRPAVSGEHRSVVPLRGLALSPAIVLLVLFMSLQSTSYYTFLTWFPFALTQDGVDLFSAGMVVSVNQFGQLAAALVMSYLIRRVERFERLEPFFLLGMAVGAVILLQSSVPAMLVGAFLLGVGHGSGLAAALAYITVKSPSETVARTVSVFVQGLGYALAGLTPLVLSLATEVGEFRMILCGLMAAISVGLVIIWSFLRSCEDVRSSHACRGSEVPGSGQGRP